MKALLENFANNIPTSVGITLLFCAAASVLCGGLAAEHWSGRKAIGGLVAYGLSFAWAVIVLLVAMIMARPR